MTQEAELEKLARRAMKLARTLTEKHLVVLEREQVLNDEALDRLRGAPDECLLEPATYTTLAAATAQAERALALETRSAVICHETGCDGEKAWAQERVSEFTARGHRIACSVASLQTLKEALAEFHDARTALRSVRLTQAS